MLFRDAKFKQIQPKTKRKVFGSLLATIGYILSPLSWWNDMFVNVPLSYVFSLPFTLISERLFLPSFIIGYWLSNLLGFVLLHRGIRGLVAKEKSKYTLLHSIAVTLLYTIVISILVWLDWIPIPTEYLSTKK